MTTSNPLLFKLSLITLAIFQVHLAHAEDTTLPVIELQADASGNQSSEQTKSYIIKKVAVQPSLILMLRKHLRPSMSSLVSKWMTLI